MPEISAHRRCYYNDSEPFVCQWLRNLIRAGHLAPGLVDPRPVQEVSPDDVRRYTQCHFFAGIGGWPHALDLAGWPRTRPVWTASLPCQPFSTAGKGRGYDDERHLWPTLRRLVQECNPPVLFGEQVASDAGRQWLARVRADLEAIGYAVGAADLCAASVGAPHIRQRLYWGAVRTDAAGRLEHTNSPRCEGVVGIRPEPSQGVSVRHPPGAEHASRLDDSGAEQRALLPDRAGKGHRPGPVYPGVTGGLVDPVRPGRKGPEHVPGTQQPGQPQSGPEPFPGRPPAGTADGFWGAADWLHCRDEKWRRVEPGSFPLADGVPTRVGRLRGYGNAIVPPLAAQFIRAFVQAMGDLHDRMKAMA